MKNGCAAFLLVYLMGSLQMAYGGPIYGPYPQGTAPDGQVPREDVNPPPVPSEAVPSLDSPGFNGTQTGSPSSPGGGSGGSPTPSSPLPNIPGGTSPGGTPGSVNNPNNQGQPVSNAPTFMNNAMPNASNPFLPNNISPGLLSGPLENAYLQNGVPQLAAPLMSVVYRPFGLSFFQPNPFQVTPQGMVSLTGYFETDTNIDFTPSNQQLGSFYSITPAIYYSNFDDYGYVSLMANASYDQYDTGNIAPYLDEMGAISAGTYLGPRVFFGAQDMVVNGFTPMMNGSPLAFFHGVNPYYYNLADAEVGIALTPKITFVQSASDMYFDDNGYGAGIMNIQSLMDTLNYTDPTDMLSLSYIYQQGIFSLFPGFISNGFSGTFMRSLTPTTSLGFGGNALDYLYQQSSFQQNFFAPSNYSLNFYMYSYYGILSHQFTRQLSMALQGGWNVVAYYSGQTFQDPLVDLNLSYSFPRGGLGINVGEFMENMQSYGVEMGPEQTYSALAYLTYRIGPNTSFYASGGYGYYDFLTPYNYSNSFFQTLQPNISYNGTYLTETDGIIYTPYPWLMTNLYYNLIEFTTNIPNETIIDNQFIALVTFMWSFK